MDNIISSYQNIFVPKRLISDNISFPHELLHIMKAKKCKTSYMACKINLEKTYDKIEWNFIRKALAKINFPDQVINWIMICIKSVSYSFSINGQNSET